ncbi:MAG: PGPGW domain-containing protein [Verrucomicrobiia bacterium]
MNSRLTPFLALTTMKKVKRILIAVAGVTVLAIGTALVVLPGPAFIVIPAGLAILATEFTWARRWLRSTKNFAKRSARFISVRTRPEANARSRRFARAAVCSGGQPAEVEQATAKLGWPLLLKDYASRSTLDTTSS